MSAALEFELPPRLEAHEPPEARGLRRDEVRLLVASQGGGRIEHTRFRELPKFLAPGDVVVVNTSATIPAALPARLRNGSPVELRLSTPAPHRSADRWWIVELRAGGQPFATARAGDTLALPVAAHAQLVAPYAGGRRLWLARLDLPEPLLEYLAVHGRPIRYDHVPREWPLDAYQNVYAREPGSAEMASAGRPFTAELVTELVARGIHVAPLTLHTGVSSPERGEGPYPERFRVPAATAGLVSGARGWGGRVIAVGTTVVRALETVAQPDGAVTPGEGWTNLVLGPERGLYAVDGLLTGWHEPQASHLELLRAVAAEELLDRCYQEALERGYRWHEFGDSHLIVP